jgi:hypothetical protein
MGKRPGAIASFIALGIVFGDIGSSPLYAFRECFHGEHALQVTGANVYGVLSLIFWSLITIIFLIRGTDVRLFSYRSVIIKYQETMAGIVRRSVMILHMMLYDRSFRYAATHINN